MGAVNLSKTTVNWRGREGWRGHAVEVGEIHCPLTSSHAINGAGSARFSYNQHTHSMDVTTASSTPAPTPPSMDISMYIIYLTKSQAIWLLGCCTVTVTPKFR